MEWWVATAVKKLVDPCVCVCHLCRAGMQCRGTNLFGKLLLMIWALNNWLWKQECESLFFARGAVFNTVFNADRGLFQVLHLTNNAICVFWQSGLTYIPLSSWNMKTSPHKQCHSWGLKGFYIVAFWRALTPIVLLTCLKD